MVAFYEFDGQPFALRIQAETVPQVEAPESVVSERHVVYSDLTVLDVGGSGPRRFRCTVRLAPSEVVAFEGKRLRTGPLTVAGVTWASATLLRLTNHQMTPKGEYHFYDAEWVL
jgi:hypothetical protein